MIETDHKSLEGVFQQRMAIARWYEILTEYQPNGIADALSRRPDLKPQTKEFHDLLCPVSMKPATKIKPTNDLVKAIIAGYAKDKVIREVRRAIKKRNTLSTNQGVSKK
ncbi:hypothetical protein PHMEG_00029322 [Phytophthora megakarya]|uniref:Reverse transcriptase RNase H-like domain-containing protein n=1 Tax=Phytophthora megakarya TaxID=4795 RepID=A0A225V3V4_9STRA|nr:hypothetical protein PHMEG_00029322 [Phytophthora megakarya]